ncbi:lipid A export permease/ATP-binding protein MsbA [Congregibacter litoralis]|uniref:Lipid A export permease/ATP-binding protein MsbA n=1 Tax=Congregibacter litoralis KT71 TaxID=314285 RepID=A4AA80_9GAMM|nr:lipid A export permease/ATP-binding protein MsbA [Congregibacter litoralis]EAQ96957.2 lipid A export permease/ATP-binding protein MsbA [Congregibacter litoralis KT71]
MIQPFDTDGVPGTQPRPSTYRRLLAYVWTLWPAFAISIVGFVLYALTQSAFASLMQYLPNAFDTMPASQRQLSDWELSLGLDTAEGIRLFLPIALVTIVAFREIGSYLGGYYITFVARNVVYQLRQDLFMHLTRLPVSFFANHNSSEIIAVITFNVEQVTSATSNAIKTLIREGLTVAALLGYLFYVNWKLSLLFLAVAPLIGLIITFTSKRFKKYSQRIQTSVGGLTQVVSEVTRGLLVMRSFGGEDYERERFSRHNSYSLTQDLKLARANEISLPIIQLLTFVSLAVLFWLGLDPTLRAGMDEGQFLSYVTAASLVAKPLRQLTSVNAGIQRGLAAAESVFEILDENLETNNGLERLSGLRGDVEFRNLSFSYQKDGKPVLKQINLKINAGETVALVGRSGAGKSTLVNLVAGFIPAPVGTLFIDRVPEEEIQLDSLRRHVAVVNQQTVLFETSIENNIAYGELRSSSREAVEQAAAQANALEFIRRLPDGLDTSLDEDGADLSGGQRQRLAIARAFLKEAPILILDEATSALDSQSEQLVQASLQTLSDYRTTLIIAHRLSTIENADRVVVMDDGQIIETGTHRELLSADGYYAQLYHRQFNTGATAEME